MKELIFQIKFLSDIVLPATSNTEGNIEQLDFIPGSNFLGMVASNYGDFEKKFQVFHSGAVRFGDAHIIKDGEFTYKMPLSYHHKKLDSQYIYNHHLRDFEKDFLPEEKGGLGQLKQKRDGYITSDKKLKVIDYNYSQKSTYDKDARKSKDGFMYGYKAITSETQWQFIVKINDNISSDDKTLIINTLEKSTRLGKSKSSQYGRVKISFIREQNVEIEKSLTKEVILYCNSRLALVDECGNSTYDLRFLCDGLVDENIVYKKTQLRTSIFTPYNTRRQTKDYERACINKGSVIVLENISQEQLTQIKNGVGVYLSEGFGDILINPEFLMDKDSFEIQKDSKEERNKNQKEKISQIFENQTVQFLVNRHNSSIEKLDIANEVAAFIKDNTLKYPKKMNSQWGTIRSLCNKKSDRTIDKEVEEYISKGVAKTKWEGDKKSTLLSAIKKSDNPLQFTKLLSMQMPKVKNIKKEQSDD